MKHRSQRIGRLRWLPRSSDNTLQARPTHQHDGKIARIDSKRPESTDDPTQIKENDRAQSKDPEGCQKDGAQDEARL
jgi:hypothetical protein